MKNQPRLEVRLPELWRAFRWTRVSLVCLGARWAEVKAAGGNTDALDEEIKDACALYVRLYRKIEKAEQRTAT